MSQRKGRDPGAKGRLQRSANWNIEGEIHDKANSGSRNRHIAVIRFRMFDVFPVSGNPSNHYGSGFAALSYCELPEWHELVRRCKGCTGYGSRSRTNWRPKSVMS